MHFGGILIQYEALGGSNGALHCPRLIGGSMYDPSIYDPSIYDPSIYDPSIYDSISYGHFLQLKQKYKLCNNYADEEIDKKVVGAN